MERHLAFRDYLRAHPKPREIYGRLKESLARQFPADIESYMDGKQVSLKKLNAKR